MPRLSPEQRALRLSGVGASEAAPILGLSPYKGPLDVWLRKPVGGRPPLVREEDEPENLQAEVGHVLEPALRELFTLRTGIHLEGFNGTLRHPDFPCVLASPDDLCANENAGVEIKVVGAHMAHHWTEDSLPDYVTVQVAQNMAVANRDAWHVLALVGSVPHIYRIERDLDLEEQILTGTVLFWEENVLGDVPPEPVSREERRRYLRERYPGSEKTACRPEDDLDGAIAGLLAARAAADEAQKAAAAEYDAATDALCALVGDSYGMEGSWGKFLWYGVQGRVDWKAVAEALAGGSIPVDIIEQHRGAGFRVPRFYPPKAGNSRSRRRA